MQIGRKDIYWNYAATFLKIASSVLLIPFILRMMPTEMIGIWTVFMTITSFTMLLDFGFNPSFTRNITYVFSGVSRLKTSGFDHISTIYQTVDYGLLKGVITAMRWFYFRMAIVLFCLLTTLGSLYIYRLLQNYNGNHYEVYFAYALLCLINTYNLFTLYYDALLQGKGLIKKSKQIVIIGHTTYLIIASILIINGYGLVAIVFAQASSVIIVRWLSYYTFFTRDIKQKLENAISRPIKEIIIAIYPNAFKIGLTSLGGFMVQRSALIIGSLYLSLEEIASYGISLQLISIIAGLAGIYTATYQPKLAQLRIELNNIKIKELYLKGQIIIIVTYFLGGLGLLFLGEWALTFIGSHTKLLSFNLLFIALFVSLEETNLSIAGNILLTKNEVPFFKASLLSGIFMVICLIVGFSYSNLGLYCMVLVPLVVDFSYQAWKWPLEVAKDLKITVKDLINIKL